MANVDFVNDPATRKAIANADRYRIMRLLRDAPGGLSAKEMAQRLGQDIRSMSFHLRILESVDVIEARESTPAGGETERVFALKNPNQRYTWDLKNPFEMSAHFVALLSVEKEETEKMIFEQARASEEGEAKMLVTYGATSVTRTTPEEIEEFRDRLFALLAEFRERRDKLRDEGVADDELRDLAMYYIVREEPASEETS